MSSAGESGGGATGVAATFDDLEFAALGTAVTVPVPVIVNPTVSGGIFSFSFNSASQAVYAVEYKNDLSAPAWAPLYNIIGTGGMLTVAEERLKEIASAHQKDVAVHLYGQEVQPETYAIAKADLIIKGLNGAIGSKKVTYDFARLMEGATEVKCSAFGDNIIAHM